MHSIRRGPARHAARSPGSSQGLYGIACSARRLPGERHIAHRLRLRKIAHFDTSTARTADLQAELDAIAERLRSTLAISRAVIDLALDAEADKENRNGPELDKQQQDIARVQAEAVSSQQALVTRVTSLTAKVKEQTEREKRLKSELEEVRQQLEDVQNAQRVPSSPSGLLLGSESMLGLSTSPARAGEAACSVCRRVSRVWARTSRCDLQ